MNVYCTLWVTSLNPNFWAKSGLFWWTKNHLCLSHRHARNLFYLLKSIGGGSEGCWSLWTQHPECFKTILSLVFWKAPKETKLVNIVARVLYRTLWKIFWWTVFLCRKVNATVCIAVQQTKETSDLSNVCWWLDIWLHYFVPLQLQISTRVWPQSSFTMGERTSSHTTTIVIQSRRFSCLLYNYS